MKTRHNLGKLMVLVLIVAGLSLLLPQSIVTACAIACYLLSRAYPYNIRSANFVVPALFSSIQSDPEKACA